MEIFFGCFSCSLFCSARECVSVFVYAWCVVCVMPSVESARLFVWVCFASALFCSFVVLSTLRGVHQLLPPPISAYTWVSFVSTCLWHVRWVLSSLPFSASVSRASSRRTPIWKWVAGRGLLDVTERRKKQTRKVSAIGLKGYRTQEKDRERWYRRVFYALLVTWRQWVRFRCGGGIF